MEPSITAISTALIALTLKKILTPYLSLDFFFSDFPKILTGTAISADPDQTAPLEQPDMVLQWLLEQYMFSMFST